MVTLGGATGGGDAGFDETGVYLDPPVYGSANDVCEVGEEAAGR